MYKRTEQGWLKHLDFMFLDLLSLHIAYSLAYAIRMGNGWPYQYTMYKMLSVVMTLIALLSMLMLSTMHQVLKRGYLVELKATLKQAIVVYMGTTAYMFVLQTGDAYSRIMVSLSIVIYVAVSYLLRVGWKLILRRHQVTQQQTMLAVLASSHAETMMQALLEQSGFRVVGVVLDKPNMTSVCGIPVICSIDEAADYVCREWVDAVFLDFPDEKLMEACWQMAVPVHYYVPGMGRETKHTFTEKIGSMTVTTTAFKYATPWQLLVKRCMDIAGGIIGGIVTLIVLAIVGPLIRKASPGPILYRQERIGLNGRKFQILKIRSMVMNADAMKQELMAQNRVKDGMMFKLDFDPRIIGNKTLPDGSHKTGIGEFIRKTSLDEFPQFFNVIKGDMSLVGTRPPTVDEWERYEYHHRARLSCKPGITGMWQVSGRSEITDFEEVVRLDTEYISQWNLRLDLKILWKTVLTVLKGRGAM